MILHRDFERFVLLENNTNTNFDRIDDIYIEKFKGIEKYAKFSMPTKNHIEDTTKISDIVNTNVDNIIYNEDDNIMKQCIEATKFLN